MCVNEKPATAIYANSKGFLATVVLCVIGSALSPMVIKYIPSLSKPRIVSLSQNFITYIFEHKQAKTLILY